MTTVFTLDGWWERMRLEPARPRQLVRSMLPLCDVLGYAAAKLAQTWDRVFRDLQLAAAGRDTPEKLRQARRRRAQQEAAARALGML